MANNKSNKVTMNFSQSRLNIDRNHSQIKPFNSFEDNNAFLFGNALSPYYTKYRSCVSEGNVKIDNNNNAWYISNGNLYGEHNVGQVGNTSYKKEIEERQYIYDNTDYERIGNVKCYFNSNNRWIVEYISNNETKTINLGAYNKDDYWVVSFDKTPPSDDWAVYTFTAWNYNIGKIDIIQIGFSSTIYDDGSISITKLVINKTKSDSHLKYSNTDVLNPFINIGLISGYTTSSGTYLLGISLFPKSGTKIQNTQRASNVIIKQHLFNFLDSDIIVWDRNTDNTQSNVRVDNTLTEVIKNINIYNNFGFFPSGNIEDSTFSSTHTTSRSITFSPCYIGNYSYNTTLPDSNTYPVFQGAFQSTYTYDNTIVRFFPTSIKYYYDTSFVYPNEFKIASSLTLYKNYYKQYAAFWKKGNESVAYNIFIAMEFSPTNMKIGNGVSIDGDKTPETMEIVTNGFGDTIDSYGTYKVLINEGEISGIATNTDVLLTPLFDIDTSESFFVGKDVIYYKSIDGNRYKISKESNNGVKSIINNRLILTDNGYAYDVNKKTIYNYALGFNNRITSGIYVDNNTKLDDGTIEAYGAYKDTYLSFPVAVINNHYEITGIPFTGTQWSPQRLYGYLDINVECTSFNIPQPIEYYNARSDKSTTPYYQLSYNFGKKSVNPLLKGLVYSFNADSPVYAVSVFSQYIPSYNRNDFIKDGYKTYPMIYSNNQAIYAFLALGFLENVITAFVIQGTAYIICDNVIMRVTIQNNQIVQTEVVINIDGLIYAGATLTSALFFSPINKSFFAFTGDITLTEIEQGNLIDTFYKPFFLQSLNTIALSVKEIDGSYYLYFFENGIFRHKIPVSNLIENCIITTDNTITMIDLNNNITEIKIEYHNIDLSTFMKKNVKFKTSYYGLGNENTQILDCWYIRLFKDTLALNGKITLKQNTFTNIGVSSVAKTIQLTADKFDKTTNTAIIRFQPKYQAATGFQLELESDYPVYEVSASFIEDSTQMTKPQLNI